MKYKIFYEDTLIGILEIDEKNQYKYTPDEEGTDLKRNEISIFPELLDKYDEQKPIALFKSRIKDAEYFGNTDVISKQTDPFKLVKVNN